MTAFRKKALSQAVVLGIAATLSQQAMAFDFQKGNWSGSWDTTISYGASWRVEDRDPNLVGKANLNPAVALMTNEQQRAAPGRWSINSDNGNLAYDDGDLISNALKITSELGFSNDNGFGGFFRVSGFYDSEYESRDDELNEDALDLVGSDIRLLDAYLYKDFEIGEKYGTVRVGRQVVSWGESTFITGGINIVNAADVTKLTTGGL